VCSFLNINFLIIGAGAALPLVIWSVILFCFKQSRHKTSATDAIETLFSANFTSRVGRDRTSQILSDIRNFLRTFDEMIEISCHPEPVSGQQ
jgi:hypothetical protein